MALSSSIMAAATILSLLAASSFHGLLVEGGNFNDDVEIQWGDEHGKIEDNGELLSLSMDKYSGSGFQSKNWFHYGRLEVEMKLVPGNSAGTVTTFYLSSQGPDKEPNHDEIDFEFLGNVSGSPYTLHTNVFVQGKGNKEMQYHLWFDPTYDFHKYSILWNPHHVIFFVDDVPIRDFKNDEAMGVPFPTNQKMRLYSSLWDGEAWATQGGKVKTDWSKAPFVAYYRNFSANACVSYSPSGASSCPPTNSLWYNQELDNESYMMMKYIQSIFRIYNYCSDVKRFPGGIPPECTLRRNEVEEEEESYDSM